MLAYEWRELELLCDHIGNLRERLAAAHKTGNTGLVEGLTAEIDRATHQRERLVRHISTRLGSVAADRFGVPTPRDTSGAGRVGRDPALMPARD